MGCARCDSTSYFLLQPSPHTIPCLAAACPSLSLAAGLDLLGVAVEFIPSDAVKAQITELLAAANVIMVID